MKLGILLLVIGAVGIWRGVAYYPEWAFMAGYLLVSILVVAVGVRRIVRRGRRDEQEQETER